MLEILTGTGLAAAAGLNAYIPLLLMGIAGRIDWIQLPNGWLWLENEWVMVILGVLFIIEIIADKVDFLTQGRTSNNEGAPDIDED